VAFLYPLFLVGLAAVAVPILLHLFRRKTEAVVDFPAVRLLQKAPVQQQRRRRLRELILLALRVSALALLAIAFARPYLPTAVASTPLPTTVVALDTSLSMSAPGQWERAQQAARQAVQDAPATHNVALVTFSDAAAVLVRPTTDRGGVVAAIDQTRPGSGGTRYRTALARSAEALASGQGRIVVVTDLQQAGWEAGDEGAVPDGIEVMVTEVAAPLENIALTGARREGNVIVAGVHNFGQRPARVTARLRTAGQDPNARDLALETVDVGAQAAAELRFAVALPPRGGAEVRIDDSQGYEGDNARFVVLDPPAPLRILIVTAQPPDSSNAGLYVERALSVADDGRAFDPRVMDGRTFSALPAPEFEQAAGIILLGTATIERSGRDRIVSFLREGGRVLVSLGPDVDLATLADTVGSEISLDAQSTESTGRTVTLVAADIRHPIFLPFASPTGALGDVYVEQYRRLNVQRDASTSVLARFAGAGDALIERSVGGGRLLVFASDLDNRWNRFPLNPAFVPWTIETARYLSHGREQHQSFTLPHVPSGVPARAGVHVVDERHYAVNPDVRESNPARTSPEEFITGIARTNEVTISHAAAVAREQEERQRLWQFGLLAMFVALAGEGLIGRRAV
jgi:hypothetical protein